MFLKRVILCFLSFAMGFVCYVMLKFVVKDKHNATVPMLDLLVDPYADYCNTDPDRNKVNADYLLIR